MSEDIKTAIADLQREETRARTRLVEMRRVAKSCGDSEWVAAPLQAQYDEIQGKIADLRAKCGATGHVPGTDGQRCIICGGLSKDIESAIAGPQREWTLLRARLQEIYKTKKYLDEEVAELWPRYHEVTREISMIQEECRRVGHVRGHDGCCTICGGCF